MMQQPRKYFSQNFLRDKNIVNKIVVAISPKKNDQIIEIGPGLGSLTTRLLPIVGKMFAVEIDRDLIPKLQNSCKNLGILTIYQQDALEFNFCDLGTKLRIVGNLPYNISTPLIFHLLDQIKCIYDMHFMLQKEVVERLSALPGTKDYGRLSVMVQYFCEATQLFTVKPQAFYPVPKVNSAIVRLIPHKKISTPTRDIEVLKKIVKQAFSQRRKIIRNSLKGIISAEQLSVLNIDPKSRPEQLSVEDFVRISNR